MGDRLWRWLGGGVASAGLVMWAIATAVLEPGIVAADQAIVAHLHEFRINPVGAEEQGQFLIWGKELRWSAIVLAIAGVTLTVRRLAVAGLAGGLAVGLFTADVMLDRSVHRTGWGYAMTLAAVALTVAALGVFALARRHRPERRDQTRTIPVLLGSAALTASVAALQVVNMTPELVPWLPAGMPAFVLVLTALLVLATVLCGLAAARSIGPSRIAGATALFLLGAGVLTAYGWYRLTGGDPLDAPGVPALLTLHVWMPMVMLVPLLVAGAVLLARGGPRRWHGWAILTLMLALAMAAAPVATMPGLGASFFVTGQVLVGLGDPPYHDIAFLLFAATSLAVAAAVWAAILTAMLRSGRRSEEAPAAPAVPPPVPVPA